MERFLIPVLAVVAVVLQTTVVPQMAVAGIAPDLIFLFILFLALRRQTSLGLWAAFGAGLLQDIAGGGILGLNALLLLGLAYLALYLRQRFFQENFVSQVLIIIFFTFLHQFLTFFFMNTLLKTDFYFSRWTIQAMGMSVYHACLGPLLFKGLQPIIRQEDVTRHVMKGQGGHSRFSSFGQSD